MQGAVGIVDADSNPDDEVRSFAFAEQKAWCELGSARHVLDSARERFRIAVDMEGGARALLNLPDEGQGDEDVGVGAAGIGDGDDGCAGCDDFSNFDVDVEDFTGVRGVQHKAVEAGFVQLEGGCGGVGGGLCDAQFFASRATPQCVELLFEGLAFCGGAAELVFDLFDAGLGHGAVFEQRAFSFAVFLEEILGRAGGVKAGGEGLDFLGSGAGADEVDLRASGVELSDVGVADGAFEGVVEGDEGGI